MKLAIFGATGSVGIHLVNQALEASHEVTVFVRDPARLGVEHPKLRIVQGDVLHDHKKIREAVTGQDAVLVTLGAGLKGRIRSEGTRNVIVAMKKQGVDRLICQSTLGAGESVSNLNLKWWFLFRVPLRMAMADHEQQEHWVRESNLSWTIVRPSAFTDDPLSGDYKFGFPSSQRDLKLTVSRADVAHFMLRQLHDEKFTQQEVSLSC